MLNIGIFSLLIVMCLMPAHNNNKEIVKYEKNNWICS
nr:MAG TPA: hypothetical protein [Caudoviricetes sp.]